MAKAKKVIRTSKAKKKWCPIIAPKSFNSQIIGETLVVDPHSKVGKNVSVSLSNLTGDMKRQNIHILFKMTGVIGDKINTEAFGYELSPSSINRMIRRGKNRVDQAFIVSTADEKKVVVKIIMVTRNYTHKKVLAKLRKINEEEMQKSIKKMKSNDLMMEIVNHKLQMNYKKLLSKIYPLQIYEIKVLKIK